MKAVRLTVEASEEPSKDVRFDSHTRHQHQPMDPFGEWGWTTKQVVGFLAGIPWSNCNRLPKR